MSAGHGPPVIHPLHKKIQFPTEYTFAYHRDRHEDWEHCRPIRFQAASTEELSQALDWNLEFGAQNVYCWTPDGWYCLERNRETRQYNYRPIPRPEEE